MTKVQYQGISDVRQINAGDTLNGAVPGGLPVTVTWSKTNNWMIDNTVAPYTALTAAEVTAILALPHGEFVDVTSVAQTPGHVTTYGSGPSGGGASAATHSVSTGATPVIAAGAGAASAAVGSAGANDRAGSFTATALATGNTADEVLLTVTFVQAYTTPPKDVNISANDAVTAGCVLYPVNITATGFGVAAHVAPANNAVLSGRYSVVG